MKRLLLIILLVALPIIIFFQYKQYRRFHPPTTYQYVVADTLDVHYHNAEMVTRYYANAYEIGAYARRVWRQDRIDVHYPDMDDVDEANAARYYNTLLAETKLLEQRLVESWRLKQQGLGNDDIQLIEDNGLAPAQLGWFKDRDNYLGLSRGTSSLTVWDLQQRLMEKGYTLTLDGVFDLETEQRLQEYQNQIGLFQSGRVDARTFDSLFMQ